jgi:hypothetical protein
MSLASTVAYPHLPGWVVDRIATFTVQPENGWAW